MTSHTLVLLRHAKAETPGGLMPSGRWPPGQGRRGRRGWPRTTVPICACSPALRTRQTWAMAEEAMLRAGAHAGAGGAGGGSGGGGADDGVGGGRAPAEEVAPLALVPGLYSAGVEAVFGLVAGVPDEIGTVLVVGHNPTVSVVSAVLDPGHGRGDGLRTAGIAVHTLAVGWSGCTRGAAPLITTHTARGSWRS
jgi:phosphohistidine phosphatase